MTGAILVGKLAQVSLADNSSSTAAIRALFASGKTEKSVPLPI